MIMRIYGPILRK